jgi:hypothetical protein
MGIEAVVCLQGVSLLALLGIFWRVSQFTTRASFVLDTLWADYCSRIGMLNTMPQFSKGSETIYKG